MLLQMERTKQVMVQFLWRKQATFEKNYQDKLLLLIHEECKTLKRLSHNYLLTLTLNLYAYRYFVVYDNFKKNYE